MKKILNFLGFVNENYQINEGGGAGITFQTNVDVNATYEVSATSVERKKMDISMDETFTAIGYDDGMNDVGTWMLKASAGDIELNTLMNIPVDSITNLDDLLDDIDMPESKRDGLEKIGDIYLELPDLVLNIALDITYKDYRDMHFGGWIRGTFKKGALIIGADGTKYDNGDYDSVTLSYDSGQTYEIYIDEKSGDLIEEVKPQLIATDTFVEFYTDVFNYEDNYNKFVKSELIDNDLIDDTYDEKVLDYIESNDLDITVDEFKADTQQYVTDKFVHEG